MAPTSAFLNNMRGYTVIKKTLSRQMSLTDDLINKTKIRKSISFEEETNLCSFHLSIYP